MTTNHPLTYLSRQCVIRNLDPNTRFPLSKRCSSLQTIDRMFPCNIDILRLMPTNIEVNDTTYKFGVIRHYENGKAPEYIQKENTEGGVPCDVEKYCLKNQLSLEDEKRIRDEEFRLNKSRITQVCKLHRLQAQDPNNVKNEDEIKDLHERIDHFYLQMKGEDPPSTHYIQLTISSGHSQKVERLVYTQTLPEAMKYLFRKLFERRHLNVYRLRMGCRRILNSERLQLNMGLTDKSILVRRLKIDYDTVSGLDDLKSFLADKSVPLELVSFRPTRGEELQIFTDPIINTAEKLVISHLYAVDSLLTAPNPRIHVSNNSLSKYDLLRIVQNWRNHEYKIGKHYSIEMDRTDATGVLKEIGKLPGARSREVTEEGLDEFPVVILPLNHFSELNCSVQRFQPHQPNFGLEYYVNMKIQAIE